MHQQDPVLVTGAGGFIGAHTAATLLARGYSVRATVQGANGIEAARKAVGSLHSAGAHMEVVVADLNQDEGWAAAVKGCSSIVHVASPLPIDPPRDPQALIRPARDGVLRILALARQFDVRRVVMTSSLAAVCGAPTVERHKHCTAADWTDLDADGVSFYNRSKTMAERAAREDMARHNGVEFVSVNPGLVFGPLASPRVNASNEFIRRMLSGELPVIPRLGYEVVDVRDVAELHAVALEHPAANGARLMASAGFLWLSEVAQILRTELAERARKVPRRMAPDTLMRILGVFDRGVRSLVPMLGQHITVDNQNSLQLGWAPRPTRAAVLASAHSLIEHRLV